LRRNSLAFGALPARRFFYFFHTYSIT
jgi:hypothetical protein